MANTGKGPGPIDSPDVVEAILEALQMIATRPLTLSVSPPSLEGRGSEAVKQFREITGRLSPVVEPLRRQP